MFAEDHYGWSAWSPQAVGERSLRVCSRRSAGLRSSRPRGGSVRVPALRRLQAGREGGMRAVVYDSYGPPESLRVDDVPTPTPSPTTNQVLLRVFATSVNLSDWECLRGAPLYARLGGLRAPARRTLGSDVAGRVEAVGS